MTASQEPITSGTAEWELCFCYETKLLLNVNCDGCGCEAWLYRDEIIHWRGGHWHIFCAFRKALEDLASLKGGHGG